MSTAVEEQQTEEPLEQVEVPVHGVLVVEGIETGDRRKFTLGALTWRDLPLPLMWPKYSGAGHDGSSVVGRIDTIERADDGKLHWSGAMNSTAEADELVGLIGDGSMRGVSVDVDSIVMELQTRDGRNAFEVMEQDGEVDENDVVETLTSGRISGATAVPIPAFMEAYIALGARPEPMVASGDAVAAQSAADIVAALPLPPEVLDELKGAEVEDLPGALRSIAEGLEPEVADEVLAAAEKIEGLQAPDPEEPPFPDEMALRASAAEVLAFADVAPGKTEDGPGWLTHPIDTDRLRDYWVRGAGAAKIGWGTPGDFSRCRAFLAEHIKPQHLSGYCANRHFDALGRWPGRHSAKTMVAAAGEHPEQVGPAFTIVAAAGPVIPPGDWFSNPNLTGPTGVTITKEGRIFGHVATWGTCHVGFPGSCVTPPTSPSDYSYFLTGMLETTDGDIRVGQITFDTGHAGLQDNGRRAMAHYDNTGAVGADVMAGEDEHGIWIAGAMRPGLTDEQVRTVKASKLSGDWREFGGNLEMVAALCVNSGGFPIPRPALAASAGRQTALVAAGVVPEPERVEKFTVKEIVASTLVQIREEEARVRAAADIKDTVAALAVADIEKVVATLSKEG